MTLPNLPVLRDPRTVAVERPSGLIDVRGRTITGNSPAPDSDEWWAMRLVGALVERRAEIVPLWERYQGRAPFPELGNPVATRTRQRVWSAFQRKARMNLAELITSCVLERMTPIGARIDRDPDAPGAVATSAPAGGDTTGGSEGPGGAQDAAERPADAPGPDARASTAEGSDDAFNATARRIWRGNHMPVQSSDLIERMLVMREAYTITGPPDSDDPRLPVVTVEDPRHTITAPDPARPYRDIAGIKLYHDPINDVDVLVLHRPGRSVRFERESSLGTARASAIDSPSFRFDPSDWRVTATADLRRWIGNRIAISRFTNRGGVGEFERHIDHLDRIDHMILQRIIVATLQAFKQRAVKGVPTKDPRTGEAIDYCVDERTEVFTRRGWLSGHEVRDGDEVRSIDPTTGLAHWSRVSSVYRRTGRTRMVHLSHASHDSMTTPGHRWLVDDADGRGRRWVTTEALDSRTRIPRAAVSGDAPQEAKFADAFVELVARWFTEGSYLSGGTAGGQIGQSQRVNPEHCDRIRAALRATCGAPDARPLTWAEDPQRANGVVVWRFGRELHEQFADVAPDKVPTVEFLDALTPAQLRLFVATALDADGHVRENASVLAQRDRARTEAFATAATLAGMAVTFHERVSGGEPMYEVTVSDRRLSATVPGAHNGAHHQRTEVDYDGLIWCPTVENDHNFLARRNGRTFYTGNSDIFTADPGALWLLPATAELWESGTVDLTPLLSATRDDVRDLAAVLRMPVQHFMPDAANQSAEGAESGREGLVARANDRIIRCDDGFADMFSLAFSYLPGDDGDDPLTITPLWKPVERFSLEARSSAAAQQNGITPWEDIMTDVLQYPPDDLPRLRSHRDADAALADAKAEAELARTTSAELEKGQQAADNAIEAARESARTTAQNRPEPSGGQTGAAGAGRQQE